MKNPFRFFLAGAALLAVGCSSGFIATPEGVGPVKLGASIEELPASCSGLYDSFVVEEIEDDYEGNYTVLRFKLDGEDAFIAYPDGASIYSIQINSPKIASAEGFAPGTPVAKLFEAGGKFKADAEGCTILAGELEYAVSGLSDAGFAKIGQAYLDGSDPEISSEDFEDDATIESIRIY